MPIYEYQCTKCQHREELIQKVSDPPLAECPRCHGPVTKLIAPPALQFKGSGWYITDYSGKGKEKSSGGSSEKKGDTAKPAADSPPSTGAPAADKKTDAGGPSPPAKSSGDGKT